MDSIISLHCPIDCRDPGIDTSFRSLVAVTIQDVIPSGISVIVVTCKYGRLGSDINDVQEDSNYG